MYLKDGSCLYINLICDFFQIVLYFIVIFYFGLFFIRSFDGYYMLIGVNYYIQLFYYDGLNMLYVIKFIKFFLGKNQEMDGQKMK